MHVATRNQAFNIALDTVTDASNKSTCLAALDTVTDASNKSTCLAGSYIWTEICRNYWPQTYVNLHFWAHTIWLVQRMHHFYYIHNIHLYFYEAWKSYVHTVVQRSQHAQSEWCSKARLCTNNYTKLGKNTEYYGNKTGVENKVKTLLAVLF